MSDCPTNFVVSHDTCSHESEPTNAQYVGVHKRMLSGSALVNQMVGRLRQNRYTMKVPFTVCMDKSDFVCQSDSSLLQTKTGTGKTACMLSLLLNSGTIREPRNTGDCAEDEESLPDLVSDSEDEDEFAAEEADDPHSRL